MPLPNVRVPPPPPPEKSRRLGPDCEGRRPPRSSRRFGHPRKPRGRPRAGWGRRDSPHLHPKTVGGENCQPDAGPVCPLPPRSAENSRAELKGRWRPDPLSRGSPQTPSHLSASSAPAWNCSVPTLGPEQGCTPTCGWRPTQSSVWPCGSQHSAIPSLVESFKLAVEG